jgi:pimeloyl-ACP methyl ester carboxylesterase
VKATMSRTSNIVKAAAIAAATVVAMGAALPASAAPTSGSAAADVAAPATAKPTVVLVHGAWADTSSFAPVTAELQKDGYTVLNAPNPLRGLASDAASVAAFVNQATTGPVVLVGHSYGGSVITNAALQAPTVKSLVYVDAYAPDEGETVLQLTGAKPGSSLAVADPTTVFNFVQYPGAADGDLEAYIKPALFGSFFAADLSKKTTAVLAASQRPVTLSALGTPSAAPAWKSVKSYFFIGANDKIIPAAEQEAMAARANGVVVKAKADHLSMLEVPEKVAGLIEKAASSK